MCECGERHDKYEYRLGYQYKDGTVHFTTVECETLEKAVARQAWWKRHNSFLLSTAQPNPWIERRKIVPWNRVPVVLLLTTK